MNTSENNGPPKWATRFLKFYCRKELLEDLEGDLNECFYRNIKIKGVKRAKLIYVFDVLTFLKPYVIRKPGLITIIAIPKYFYHNFTIPGMGCG